MANPPFQLCSLHDPQSLFQNSSTYFCTQCFCHVLQNAQLLTEKEFITRELKLLMELEADNLDSVLPWEAQKLMSCVLIRQLIAYPDREYASSIHELLIMLFSTPSAKSDACFTAEALSHICLEMCASGGEGIKQSTHSMLRLFNCLLAESRTTVGLCVPQETVFSTQCLRFLIACLNDKREPLKQETLVVLENLALLNGHGLIEFSDELVPPLVEVMLQTENDDARYTILSILHSLLVIHEQHKSSSQGAGGSIQIGKIHIVLVNPSLLPKFVDSLKKALLSTQDEVVSLALDVITDLTSQNSKFAYQFTQSGVLEYVFEALRTESASTDNVLLPALKALNEVAAASDGFPDHFVFGYEVVLHILEQATEERHYAVVSLISRLFASGFLRQPGNMSRDSLARVASCFSIVIEIHHLEVEARTCPESLACCFVELCSALGEIMKWKENLEPLDCNTSALESIRKSASVLSMPGGYELPQLSALRFLCSVSEGASLCVSTLSPLRPLPLSQGSILPTLYETVDVNVVPFLLVSVEGSSLDERLEVAFFIVTKVLQFRGLPDSLALANNIASCGAIDLLLQLLDTSLSVELKHAAFTFIVVVACSTCGVSVEEKTSFFEIANHYAPSATGLLGMLSTLREPAEDRHELDVRYMLLVVLLAYVMFSDSTTDDQVVLHSLECFIQSRLNCYQRGQVDRDSDILRLLTCFTIVQNRVAHTMQDTSEAALHLLWLVKGRDLSTIFDPRKWLHPCAIRFIIAGKNDQERSRHLLKAWLVALGRPFLQREEGFGNFLPTLERFSAEMKSLFQTVGELLVLENNVDGQTVGCLTLLKEVVAMTCSGPWDDIILAICHSLSAVVDMYPSTAERFDSASVLQQYQKILVLHGPRLPEKHLTAILEYLCLVLKNVPDSSLVKPGTADSWTSVVHQCLLLMEGYMGEWTATSVETHGRSTLVLHVLNMLNVVLFRATRLLKQVNGSAESEDMQRNQSCMFVESAEKLLQSRTLSMLCQHIVLFCSVCMKQTYANPVKQKHERLVKLTTAALSYLSFCVTLESAMHAEPAEMASFWIFNEESETILPTLNVKACVDEAGSLHQFQSSSLRLMINAGHLCDILEALALKPQSMDVEGLTLLNTIFALFHEILSRGSSTISNSEGAETLHMAEHHKQSEDALGSVLARVLMSTQNVMCCKRRGVDHTLLCLCLRTQMANWGASVASLTRDSPWTLYLVEALLLDLLNMMSARLDDGDVVKEVDDFERVSSFFTYVEIMLAKEMEFALSPKVLDDMVELLWRCQEMFKSSILVFKFLHQKSLLSDTQRCRLLQLCSLVRKRQCHRQEKAREPWFCHDVFVAPCAHEEGVFASTKQVEQFYESILV